MLGFLRKFLSSYKIPPKPENSRLYFPDEEKWQFCELSWKWKAVVKDHRKNDSRRM